MPLVLLFDLLHPSADVTTALADVAGENASYARGIVRAQAGCRRVSDTWRKRPFGTVKSAKNEKVECVS